MGCTWWIPGIEFRAAGLKGLFPLSRVPSLCSPVLWLYISNDEHHSASFRDNGTSALKRRLLYAETAPVALLQVVTRTEKESSVVAFACDMVPFPVTADMTLQQVLTAMNKVRHCFTKMSCNVLGHSVVSRGKNSSYFSWRAESKIGLCKHGSVCIVVYIKWCSKDK